MYNTRSVTKDITMSCKQSPHRNSKTKTTVCGGMIEAPPVHLSKYPKFKDGWNLYYHDADNKNWDLGSYTLILNDIRDPEQLISINETIPENIVRNAMLFVMRNNIQPIWEDEKNRHGGYLSFRIPNKTVFHNWKSIFYGLCGETLFKEDSVNSKINGISISPKKTFCIIKLWMSSCDCKDAELNPILHLNTTDTKFTPFSETDAVIA